MEFGVDKIRLKCVPIVLVIAENLYLGKDSSLREYIFMGLQVVQSKEESGNGDTSDNENGICSVFFVGMCYFCRDYDDVDWFLLSLEKARARVSGGPGPQKEGQE